MQKRSSEPWLLPVDSLILAYQILMALVVLVGNVAPDLKAKLLFNHLFFCLPLLGVLWALRDVSHPWVRFFRELYPLMAMLFFYRGTGLLVHAFFDWTLDEWLVKVDDEMGRVGTSLWIFQQFYPPSRLLNEFFSIGYSFYFLLLPLTALTLYFRAPLGRLRTFMFSLCFTYFLHYFLFILLPAESPRFHIPGLRESLQGYWVSDWLKAAVEKNAYPGGSFPSSHVAAAVICMRAWPYWGKLRFPVLFLTVAMFIGTVYGRYHYFVDVVAGLGVGLCCYWLAPWLEKKWPVVIKAKAK